MIIGNGMLAKEFNHYKLNNNIVIFASGVSNSKEVSQDAFNREKVLLVDVLKNCKGKRIVYFSTCSMYDDYFKNNAYTLHKLEMEEILTGNNIDYTIFRLPQVLGSNNKFQLMGFLYDKIKNKKLFDLYDIERNIIDITDVRRIVNYIIKHNLFANKIINVANPSNVRVVDLVKKIENIYNYKANYNLIEISGGFDIDISDIDFILLKLDLFKDNYIEQKIIKYYG